MTEIPKNHDIIEDKRLKEGQKEGEDSQDKALNEKFEKGGKDIADGMDHMAKQEVDAIKKSFSADESANPTYNAEFTKAQKDFTAETQDILSGEGKPAEKMKALDSAFKAFKEQVASIKGKKEGMDAQRASRQGENIKEEEKKNEQGSQEFKEALLKGMEKHHTEQAQKQQKAATFLGEKESGYAQQEATKEISDTLAF